MHSPSILLMGEAGSGKTHSLRTLVEAGITPFILFTEAGEDILMDIPPEKCHWHHVSPTTGGWEGMSQKVDNITKMTWDQIVKMSDSRKREYQGYSTLIHNCANFKCDRTGEEFGDVTSWGNDRALVLDSLSGLNDMILQTIKGGATYISQPQWGSAMGLEMEFLTKLCNDTKCYFIMTAHIERLVDEVVGGQTLLPLALGRKNAPQIPRHFSDVIYTEKVGDKWVWRTEAANMSLKARNLPYSKELPPDFGLIVKTFNERKERGET